MFAKKAVELEPEEGDAHSLLQEARAQLQHRFELLIRRFDMNLRKAHAASWITALILMFGHPAQAQDRFFDDFEDGDLFDDDPVSWVPADQVICGANFCCQGEFEVVNGDLRVRQTGIGDTGIFLQQPFEGDISVRARVAFLGQGSAAEIGLAVHLGGGCINGYAADLSTDGEITKSIECDDAADTDDSGTLDVTDAVFLFNFLFAGDGAPPAPGVMECGEDATEDLLGCTVGCAN